MAVTTALATLSSPAAREVTTNAYWVLLTRPETRAEVAPEAKGLPGAFGSAVVAVAPAL